MSSIPSFPARLPTKGSKQQEGSERSGGSNKTAGESNSNSKSKRLSSSIAAEDIRPDVGSIKKRNHSFANGELAAQIRRVSQLDLMSAREKVSINSGKPKDLEQKKDSEKSIRTDSERTTKRATKAVKGTKLSDISLDGIEDAARTSSRRTSTSISTRSRRASAPDIGALGSSLRDDNPFADYHSTIFKSTPNNNSNSGSNNHNNNGSALQQCNICDLLFDVLDSTEFEAFSVFMVMVLILVLLIGEYYLAKNGAMTSTTMTVELEITSMVIISIFLVEMCLKILTFGSAFVKVPSNVADTFFTLLAFCGQITLLLTMSTKDYSSGLCAFVRISLYLVVILRQNRVGFFLHHLRAAWNEQRNLSISNDLGKTIVQKSITILKNLRDNHGIRGAQSLQIDWLIDIISSGTMYNKEAEYVEDSETRAFLEMQVGRQGSSTGTTTDSDLRTSILEEFDASEEKNEEQSAGKNKTQGKNEFTKKEEINLKKGGLKRILSAKSVRTVVSEDMAPVRSRSSRRASPGMPNRRTTRFVPSTAPAMRAPLSVRASQQAKKKPGKAQKSGRRSFVGQISASQFKDTFNEASLRDSNFGSEVATWSCDIHSLCNASDGHPLELIATTLWKMLDINTISEINETCYMKFISSVQSTYPSENTYHNSTHAADVTQTVSMFLRDPTIDTILNITDRFCAIIAAAIHDMGHPGTNNNFGMKTKSIWAIKYNDRSILENMHVSKAFELMKNDEELNILSEFATDQAREMRENIINMVLGTDMSFHFEDISHFQAQVCFLFLRSSIIYLYIIQMLISLFLLLPPPPSVICIYFWWLFTVY